MGNGQLPIAGLTESRGTSVFTLRLQPILNGVLWLNPVLNELDDRRMGLDRALLS